MCPSVVWGVGGYVQHRRRLKKRKRGPRVGGPQGQERDCTGLRGIVRELCRAALQGQFSQTPAQLPLWARLLKASEIY